MSRGLRAIAVADDTQPAAGRVSRSPIANWMRWIAGGRTTAAQAASASSSVCARVRGLPGLLDGSTLPNGVVELVVDDTQTPTRQLFDVHDGVVTLVELGSAVPWASIAGPPAAWTLALGPTRSPDGLRLTGDETLARRVLAALPASNG